jgi:lysophospholipase L1-like esterase
LHCSISAPIGTNDATAGQSTKSTVKEIGQIIDALRTDNPTVIVFLAKLIPSNRQTINQRIIDLNRQIDGIAAAKTTAQSPVIVVDQNSGFDASQDTYDGVHPNGSGEAKMAGKWLQAIVDVLP